MDRRYVGDITYVATWEGWYYVAKVVDQATDCVVGWALADHKRTEWVEHGLKKTYAQRVQREKPGLLSGATHHKAILSRRRLITVYWEMRLTRSALG